MNCKQARRLMQEMADGTRTDHAELDQHIAQCPRCRLEWQALQRLEGAVASIARCEPPAERLERATVGALRMIERQRPRVLPGLSRLGWAAAAALLIAIFATGLYAGRTVWPRELIVKVPEVHEKIVEVEVPVIKERVVIKRVPVVKERIVYRERDANARARMSQVMDPMEEAVAHYGGYGGEELIVGLAKCDEIVVRVAAKPIPSPAQIRQAVRPARFLDGGESEDLSPSEDHGEQPDSAIMEFGDTEIALALGPASF